MVDNVDELKTLPYKVEAGSQALVTSTMDLYLLNNQNTWVKIRNLKVSGGSSSGGSGDGGSDEGDKTYIWDGGDI